MKQSITAAVRDLIVARLEESSPAEISRIVGALAANDQIEASAQVAAFSTPRGIAAAAIAPRFVNLNSQGQPADELGGWVYDRRTGLIWQRSLLGGGPYAYADAMKACANVKFMGHACRAPTIEERQSIIDYSRHSPALDTAHFAKEEGWEWTSTVDASSPSGFAWGVDLGAGHCYRGYQSYRGYVRAVLAGQQLNLSL